jgi:hypothetical protein
MYIKLRVDCTDDAEKIARFCKGNMIKAVWADDDEPLGDTWQMAVKQSLNRYLKLSGDKKGRKLVLEAK